MNGLKEWATVVRALECGDQTVLLRKGGILDVASGFVIESKKFFLFPTFEHQSLANLKPKFHNYLSLAMGAKPPEGQNRISSYAEVLAEADVSSQEKLDRLSEFHIWSDSYIKTRVEWMPDKPIKAVFLKTHRVSEFDIPLKPEYQGCKSWIEINAKLDSGRLAMSDTELDAKLAKFLEIVR